MKPGLNPATDSIQIRDLTAQHEFLMAQHKELCGVFEAADINATHLIRELAIVQQEARVGGLLALMSAKRRAEGLRKQIGKGLKLREKRIAAMNDLMARATAIDREVRGDDAIDRLERQFSQPQRRTS